MSRKRCVTLDSHLLNEHDRLVLRLWSGQPVPRHGDVTLELNKQQAQALEELLLILGK